MALRGEEHLSGHRHIAYDVLNRIASLEMRARELVEGTMAGLQRSPYLGVSSEFAQHRAYVPGDDVRHVDWKVYSRTERYYVRQFQEETNFVVSFLLDASESMRYGSTGTTKLDYACLIAASLAYLVLRQSDAVSLALFDESLLQYLPPRTGMGALGLLASQFEALEPVRGTGLPKVAALLAEQLSRRGIIVILSDLLDIGGKERENNVAAVTEAVQRLRLRRHEVIVFHVLDPQEVSFDFTGRTRFEGLESLPTAVAEPTRIRADYLDLVYGFLREVKSQCAQARADYALANTSEPVDRLLIRYLSARAKVREGRR